MGILTWRIIIMRMAAICICIPLINDTAIEHTRNTNTTNANLLQKAITITNYGSCKLLTDGENGYNTVIICSILYHQHTQGTCVSWLRDQTERHEWLVTERPDGVTLTPWKSGLLLAWDATVPDTFAQSYRAHATLEPGKMATAAENQKWEVSWPSFLVFSEH